MKTFCLMLACFWMMTSCASKSNSDISSKIPIPEKDTIPANPMESKTDQPVLGIDVSHFQGNINWEEIKADEITFAYDKATQGASFKDPDYAQNKRGAHEVGLAHGSYHFFTSDADPMDQAALFIATIDYTSGDMPPVLDLEQGGIVGTVKTSEFQDDVLSFLLEIERKLGIKPIIYTNHPFGNEYLDNPKFSEYGLWIAEYEVDTPKIPKTWEEKGWLIWQRSERGKVQGAMGNVDHDLFNPTKPFELVKK
ncbi:glycoside hydrolase family 25 protein [Algoriphagus halophytocola]|uniref:Glycoside hydrolase family 25 protein n=1 Tax=Algoriphagus halophytocola TaxID=2991499 RepID=A0ABY6MK31_9BACT|nr:MULTISPECIES: glycoside hydrolase family 25 protein [unclassified Algoriphagus]UZD24132.1 glycoside hydrolase family 25 protein [Algoriphagus sp. TR-M5]WBL41503.1 glycoside hydrolase family 25 protein [Algoriphagus sp. TR-M9]